LINLLDPATDAVEIAELKEKSKQVSNQFRTVTPVVVPLTPHVAASEMMQNSEIRFDLDGHGMRRCGLWPSVNATKFARCQNSA